MYYLKLNEIFSILFVSFAKIKLIARQMHVEKHVF